jgi:hypothetical protein
MIKGTINTGLTIGSYIGNRAILDINTVGLVAGKVSAKQYISSLETIINDVEAIKSMPGAMATGIKNSVVNLATNGLDFFSYETSLAEKTQLVTDFTTVVGTVEAAHGLYKLSKPHLSSLRQRISSSNWYRTLASERGSVTIGPNSGAGKVKFGSVEKLEQHFAKHGGEFKGIYNNADEYLQGARDVMQNGTKVSYVYKGETRTGFLRFMGNNSKGVAKFEFVGTNNAGQITTYHVESGKTFWKMLNGENVKVINPLD